MTAEENLLNFQLFYSQGRRGNSNTRETPRDNIFLKDMYVDTNLDRCLTEDIVSGKFDLVLITGNPGDGKTAFLKRLEEAGINSVTKPNGKIFEIGKTKIEVNYDGSQDHRQIHNSKILQDLFIPVERALNAKKRTAHVRVIAINEGRLLKHLDSKDAERNPLYPLLQKNVEFQLRFRNDSNNGDDSILVVDLNKRSVVARREDNSSILEDLLVRISDKKWWDNCLECEVREHCPVNINISNLSRSLIRDRFRELVRMASLWGKFHVTIRDTLSALSFIIFGEDNCDDIRERLSEKNDGWEKWILDRLYFNSITNGSSKDRLLSTLSIFKIYRMPAPPKLDGAAYFSLPSQIIKDFAKESDNLELERIIRLIDPVAKEALETDTLDHFRCVKNLIFFEGTDDYYKQLVPITYYENFKSGLGLDENTFDDFPIRRQIILALNRSHNLKGSDLCVEHTESTSSKIISFSEFPIDDFELSRNEVDPKILHYCEAEPGKFSLNYLRSKRNDILLEIDLEMYNMIEAIGNGYVPTRNELEGKFFNLGIFMELLEELGGKQVKIYDTVSKQQAVISVNPRGRVEVN